MRRVPRHCSIEPPGCPPQPTAPFKARNRDRRSRVPYGHSVPPVARLYPAHDSSDNLKNLLDDERSKAERRLVEEKKLGLGHQPPSDRHHLLLATGELPTQHIREGFQLGKDSKHLLCVSLKLTA